jgi:hypothetical protein
MDHAKEISKAEATHTEMVGRLLSARASLAEGDARRQGLALAVETGDADARREAATLAKAADGLAERIRNLVHAVEQAKQHVTAARLDADNEAKRQAATKARAVAARLAERGAQLDEGLRQAREAYLAFQSDLRELAGLGAPAPSANLIYVNAKRALDTALADFHSQIRPVQQSQRHNFDELLRGWARPSELWAAGILDAPPTIIRVIKEVA